MPRNTRRSGKRAGFEIVFASLFLLTGGGPAQSQEAELEPLIRTLLDQSSTEEVAFREVVRAATGHRVLPLNPDSTAGKAIIEAVSSALDRSLIALAKEDSPVYDERRINEVSRHFEAFLEKELDQRPGFRCSRPLTEEGKLQSSGYPDLRLIHQASGKVVYLDPKLVREDSLGSSFRTFYYTPRNETNKITEDAYHLLAGIQHDGKTGAWSFTGWKLISLHDFQIRLKAEYQASNRDLYREELTVGQSGQ